MNIAIALVFGLLIGWLVEWVIDWFYWRHPRRAQGLVSEPKSAAAPDSTQRIRYTTRPADADDLKKVKGIGPVIEKRLNKAGIYKYEQIAELTLEEFEKVLEDLLRRFVSSRTILGHARELAEEKRRGDKA